MNITRTESQRLARNKAERLRRGKNREKFRKYAREYHAKNRDRLNLQQNRRYHAHRDEICAGNRARYHAMSPQQRSLFLREQRASRNPVTVLKQKLAAKRWVVANKEKRKAAATRYERKKAIEILPSYVRPIIKRSLKIGSKDIPDSLIEAYTALIKLKRQLWPRQKTSPNSEINYLKPSNSSGPIPAESTK